MNVDLTGHDTITTWHALIASGVTPGHIRAQLAAQRWRRWGYAIALHNGPLLPQEQWHVARVHGGPGALLTGFTALQACGLRTWERPVVDVLCKSGVRGARWCPVGVRRHYRGVQFDVRRITGSSIQVPAQAMFVVSGELKPRAACGLITACAQQRVLSIDRAAAELAARPNLRHRRLLLATIGDIRQGAEALSEIDFVRLCRRYRLPTPQQQTIRPDRNGRRRYLDASWERSDGQLVAVEVDGALHLSQRRWWSDQLRQNDLVIRGTLLLRYPSAIVRTEPLLVATQLAQALRLPIPRG